MEARSPSIGTKNLCNDSYPHFSTTTLSLLTLVYFYLCYPLSFISLNLTFPLFLHLASVNPINKLEWIVARHVQTFFENKLINKIGGFRFPRTIWQEVLVPSNDPSIILFFIFLGVDRYIWHQSGRSRMLDNPIKDLILIIVGSSSLC